HASQEELKMLLSLRQPTCVVPVHGEYRHLASHAALAQSMGIPEENTFVLEDGDVLELTEEKGVVAEKVQAGRVYVDGQMLWSTQSPVIEERRRLSRDGVVVVAITVDAKTGVAKGAPELASAGFVELDESQELFEKTSKMVLTSLEKQGVHALELDEVKSNISDSVSNFLYKETRRRPTVLTVIEQV
ncbi:MAG: ribonuclease J, partial [Chloroflexi bacterium]|nr:ribonuclease J [Chloroflexota bacterium]